VTNILEEPVTMMMEAYVPPKQLQDFMTQNTIILIFIAIKINKKYQKILSRSILFGV
jgi:hypothetical protein